jgi:hypothetical protein
MSLLDAAGAYAQTTVYLGETAKLGYGDSGNANLLAADGPWPLPQQAAIKSLSFWIGGTGQFYLSVYDASGPNRGPGKLVAQTAAAVTPKNGAWVTVPTTTQPTLPAGNYWLAYLPSSNSLSFRKGLVSGATNAWAAQPYAAGLPSTFPAGQSSDGYVWSLYATLVTVPVVPALNITFSPANPNVPANLPAGTVVAQAVVTWSDGSPFTGACAFASPYFSDGTLFALTGTDNCEIVVAGNLLGLGNTTQDVTVQASQ